MSVDFRVPYLFVALVEKSGKMLHLLKSSSKPTKLGKKRRKIDLLGTFTEYQQSKQKASQP